MTEYVSTREVQNRYRISRSSIYRWTENPNIGFPAPLKIGQRILWRESDLAAFDARAAAGRTTT